MKENNIKIYAALFLLLLTFGSCKKQLDINTDNSRLSYSQLTAANLLPTTIQYTALSYFNVGQFGNYYPQYFAGASGQETNIDSYKGYGFDNIWESAYLRAMPNIKDLMDVAQTQGAPQYAGIAKLMMALNLMQCTDIWGDLPYSEAFKGVANIAPKYDSQEQIYTIHLKNLLDGAIEDLQKPVPTLTTLQVSKTTDLIYQGDIAKWLKAAYGARARYYLHLSTKDAGNFAKAVADANLAISDQTGASDLQLKYVADVNNSPWFTNLGNTGVDSKHAKPSTYFINLLNGTYYTGLVDPRLAKLVDKGTAATYIGRPVGVPNANAAAKAATANITATTFYGAKNSIVPILTYSEVQFILAESLFATDKNAAYNAYLNGIKGSLMKITGLPATDPGIKAYMENDQIDKAGDVNALTLSDIMIQKYIAQFMQMETWNDMRRYQYSTTIYPGLAQPTVNTLGTAWIQRANYPDNEPGRNPNVPKIASQAEKIWLFNN